MSNSLGTSGPLAPVQGDRSDAGARRADLRRQLADWGADVIKIEAPEGDAGMGGDATVPTSRTCIATSGA